MFDSVICFISPRLAGQTMVLTLSLPLCYPSCYITCYGLKRERKKKPKTFPIMHSKRGDAVNRTGEVENSVGNTDRE